MWKVARIFAREIAEILCKPCFSHDFALRNGLNSTALSVMENIAEGFERESRKEFAQFIKVAKGSNGEARSLLYAARDRGHLSDPEYQRLLALNISVAKMLRALHQALCRPRT